MIFKIILHRLKRKMRQNQSLNNEYYLEFLPKGYKYLYNKGDNNIFNYE